jgi:SAM-dependent methyltransferase
MSSQRRHDDQVVDRFTKTAAAFAADARARRSGDAERFAQFVTAGFANASQVVAVDVACGPGTYTFPLARRVRKAIGVDLTPAMLEQAQAEAARQGLTNLEWKVGDSHALPFADGFAGIAGVGYSLHHMLDLESAVAEMARIVAPGGRVGIVDLVIPEGADAAANEAIERARDSSHTSKQTGAGIRALLRQAGLRLLNEESYRRPYAFDDWMSRAGHPLGDPAYVATRRLLEESIPGDTAGFQPVISPSGAISFSTAVFMAVAEKPA